VWWVPALDGLALASDPVGALPQHGISWLIEHVKLLAQPLDWLAGDPGTIAGHAQTWRNVAQSLQVESDTLEREVRLDVAEWWSGGRGHVPAVGGIRSTYDTSACAHGSQRSHFGVDRGRLAVRPQDSD
jgi:hypothetical protein